MPFTDGQCYQVACLCCCLVTLLVFDVVSLSLSHSWLLHWSSDLQTHKTVWKNRIKLECQPTPNVMTTLPNIGGVLCSMLESLADAHYSSAVPYRCKYRRMQDLDAKWILHLAKFHYVGARAPWKCIYSIPAQEMAKHRAKFGWPLLSDVSVSCILTSH